MPDDETDTAEQTLRQASAELDSAVRAGRAARAALAAGRPDVAARRLRRHLILMGASYVGAWSGFFATNPVFGVGEDWQVWLTVFGPTAVGAVVIARAALRLGDGKQRA